MAQQAAEGDRSTILGAGTPAPDFDMPSTGPEKALKLSSLRGHPVIVAFNPADWSPVCGDQMAFYNEILPDFREHDADLVGISVDGVWCHAAFAQQRKLRFPLLSDFEPKGAVSRSYGAYRTRDGYSERALFLVDGDGLIQWSFLSPVDVNPGAAGILQALESMSAQASARSRQRGVQR